MNKNRKGKYALWGCLTTIAIWGITGKVAWDLTTPDSFVGGLKFTLIWTLLAAPLNAILGYVLNKLGINKEEEKIEMNWEDHHE